jgi:transcriptional regulator with XRE-family HTH domain
MASMHPIERYRQARRLSREELAAALGVTKTTIWRWEKRERFPDRKHWLRIREVTGISTAELTEQ